MTEPILVSACLLGLKTRYDGRSKRNRAVFDYLAANNLTPIPVCPEQLAGLPTPREATRFAAGDGADVLQGDGRVVSVSGRDMNPLFLHGAREVLTVARLTGCRRALLKERSPSCGVHQVYLDAEVVPGLGVTTAFLREEGFQVMSEEDL